MIDIDGAVDFFRDALEYSLFEYPEEVRWADSLSSIVVTPDVFLGEYIWIVLASGFSAKAARKVEKSLYGEDGKMHLDAVRHEGKRRAIETATREYESWYHAFMSAPSDEARMDFLDSLPYIGPVTKYHMAKNLGLEVAKPDRHLVRLAGKWGFRDVQEMCKMISVRQRYPVAVVDQVLWRYCADHPSVAGGRT